MLDQDQVDARALIFMSAEALLAGISPETLFNQICRDTLTHGASIEDMAETIAALVIEAAKLVSSAAETVAAEATSAAS